MSYITRLSTDSQNYISKISLSGKSRSLETTIAISKALADTYQLPPTQVESIIGYFNLNNMIDFESILSMLNEIMLLDIAAIKDLTLKFYEYRYQQAFPSRNALAINKDTAIVDLFKISSYINNIVLGTITDNCLAITEGYNKITKIVDELKITSEN